MFKISLYNVDELYSVLWDLSTIAYLQRLVQEDTEGHPACGEELPYACESAQALLWKMQYDTVLRFKKLLENEEFCKAMDEQ